MTVENNLYYNCGSVQRVGGTNTVDYNSYLGSGQAAIGSHDVSVASPPDPFANLSVGNVSLASENADWTSRLALSAPYDVDLYGTPYTTDRGAAQYCDGGCMTALVDGGVPSDAGDAGNVDASSTPDAGVEDDGGSGAKTSSGGCGCFQAGKSVSPSGIALLGLVLIGIRRRRASSRPHDVRPRPD
jgi:hypothetical protein